MHYTVCRINIITVSASISQCLSLSFSTAITSLKSHLSLQLRARELQFSNVVNERSDDRYCSGDDRKSHRDRRRRNLLSHDWISKRIFWQIEFALLHCTQVRRRFFSFSIVWTAARSRTLALNFARANCSSGRKHSGRRILRLQKTSVIVTGDPVTIAYNDS